MSVGTVTSGGFSPTLTAPVAMGYVAAEHAEPGTTLHIDVRGKTIAAAVAPLPFVRHRYHRT
jgi:aminomethyltransferase